MQSLYATTLGMAGLAVPETVEFPSIEGLLNGKNKDGAQELIFGAYLDTQRMVRTDQYKLIHYPEIKKYQLFDIRKDPTETSDLAGDKKYAGVKQGLIVRLVKKQKELEDHLLGAPKL